MVSCGGSNARVSGDSGQKEVRTEYEIFQWMNFFFFHNFSHMITQMSRQLVHLCYFFSLDSKNGY